ncbi:YceI family protein [Sphingomicrobium astaxanthinifaciens]|uniref:YceI family protein n=1 Tax=Sphingomicrobium astaxanthinifaciens TaxID=1227949 RepID=UPI001FCAB98B|nr:YceI family protein [Sphingomicrobium astaxanthinifaciens]MCJ7420709.1 YceI family protein [Sphingomicrobium astaxanthinifaciens]
MVQLLAAVLAAFMALGSPAYEPDASASRVSAKVAFLGLASKTARFPAMEGSILVDPADRSRVDLRVDLDARHLEASDGVTRRRLKGEKFFWVERYPMVRFHGTSLQLDDDRRGRIAGTVTARGVTRPVTLEVAFDRPVAALDDGQPVRLAARTRIDRRDFGMTGYRPIVGNKVRIRIEARMVPIVAR